MIYAIKMCCSQIQRVFAIFKGPVLHTCTTRSVKDLLIALKGPVNSKFHFSPNYQIFLHIQSELHFNSITYTTTLPETEYFGKRDNLLGINFCQRKLIQASRSIKKKKNHLNLDLLKFWYLRKQCFTF